MQDGSFTMTLRESARGATYASQRQPAGLAPHPDPEAGLGTMRHPCVMSFDSLDLDSLHTLPSTPLSLAFPSRW